MTHVDESTSHESKAEKKRKKRSRRPISTAERRAWTPGQWCAEAGPSRSTLYRLIADGRVKAVKYGRSTFITTTPAEFVASLEPVELSGAGADAQAI
jgi:hypothetical protein